MREGGREHGREFRSGYGNTASSPSASTNLFKQSLLPRPVPSQTPPLPSTVRYCNLRLVSWNFLPWNSLHAGMIFCTHREAVGFPTHTIPDLTMKTSTITHVKNLAIPPPSVQWAAGECMKWWGEMGIYGPLVTPSRRLLWSISIPSTPQYSPT